jgi:hypothetical protein
LLAHKQRSATAKAACRFLILANALIRASENGPPLPLDQHGHYRVRLGKDRSRNALLFIATTGCQSRMLPREFPPLELATNWAPPIVLCDAQNVDG